MTSYLVKQREFIRNVRIKTPWFQGTKASFGKWITLAKCATLDEAIRIRRERSLVGLKQVVVMHRGKIVVDHLGAVREPDLLAQVLRDFHNRHED